MFKTAKTSLSHSYEDGLFYVYNRELNLLKGDEATAYNQLKTSLEKGGIVQDTELLHLYDIKINSKKYRFYVKANINKINDMKKYNIYFGHFAKDIYGNISPTSKPVMSLILDTFSDFNTKNLISSNIKEHVRFSIDEHGHGELIPGDPI